MIQTCTKQATFTALSHAHHRFVQWESSSVPILSAPHYTCSKELYIIFACALSHIVKYISFEC